VVLPLERELLFHPGRRWRADLAHLPTARSSRSRALYPGRHTRAQGFMGDTEKYFEAAMAGWRVLRLSERELTTPIVARIIAFLTRA